MGMAGTWRYDLKMTDVVSVGNKSRGFKGAWQTLPLQNQLMPSGILACILLQATERYFNRVRDKTFGEGEVCRGNKTSGEDDT